MKAPELCFYFKIGTSQKNTIVQHLLLVRFTECEKPTINEGIVIPVSWTPYHHIHWAFGVPQYQNPEVHFASLSLLRSHQAVYPVRLGVAMNSTRMPTESLGTLWMSNFAICEVDNIIRQINSCLNHVYTPYMTATDVYHLYIFIRMYWQSFLWHGPKVSLVTWIVAFFVFALPLGTHFFARNPKSLWGLNEALPKISTKCLDVVFLKWRRIKMK